MFTSRFLRSFLFDPASDAAAGGGGGSGGDAGAAAAGAAAASSSAAASGSEASPFDFRTLVTEKGEFVEGWQEKLPQDFDPHRKTLANFRDFGSLSKALADNMTAARAKTEGMLKIPGADAKPEELAAFHKALGVPDKPEDYGLKAPEKLPEGLEWDPKFADGFTKAAHEAGLSKAQVEKLAAWHLQQESERAQNVTVEGTKAYDAEVAKLRSTFGENFDKRMIDVKRVAATVGLPEDHPVFWRADTVQAFAKFADLISEDRLVTTAQVGNKLSPESAAKDIMTNKDNPDYSAYNDPSHGRHKEVVAFVQEQMKRAYPG